MPDETTEDLVERAIQAMAEGVARYFPVDGHDWRAELTHETEESPAVTPRDDRAPGSEEGSIAPTG